MKHTIRIILVLLLIFILGATLSSSAGAGKNSLSYRVWERKTVVKVAKRYLGVPYVWGASSPRGFDCSGLIKYVYAKINIYLPHYTYSMYQYGRYVSKENLLPGDLVFFANKSHVGMYIGGGRFIHAPRTGDYVKISLLRDRNNFYGAKRII